MVRKSILLYLFCNLSYVWFTSLLDHVHHFFTYRSLEWDQTGPVSIAGENTWRDGEDVMCHIWVQNDRLLYTLDTAEAGGSFGVDRVDERRFKLCQLWQLLSKPFHHDWGCFQQHSVPSGRESDSRRCCCLLLCSTPTVTEDSGAAEQKPPQTTSSNVISVTSVFPQSLSPLHTLHTFLLALEKYRVNQNNPRSLFVILFMISFQTVKSHKYDICGSTLKANWSWPSRKWFHSLLKMKKKDEDLCFWVSWWLDWKVSQSLLQRICLKYS